MKNPYILEYYTLKIAENTKIVNLSPNSPPKQQWVSAHRKTSERVKSADRQKPRRPRLAPKFKLPFDLSLKVKQDLVGAYFLKLVFLNLISRTFVVLLLLKWSWLDVKKILGR